MLGTDISCIILAGGLGTRLRGTIGDIPKCMAPVAGRPFIHYLFRYLEAQGIQRVVLSLGFRAQDVLDWICTEHRPFTIAHVLEDEPLGTGGGISLAMQACTTGAAFVINGDTLFDVDLNDMYAAFLRDGAETMLALKALRDFDRYGTVSLNTAGNRIAAFREKQPMAEGLINGGIYCIDRKAFMKRRLPTRFSFEKEYLEACVQEGAFAAYRSDGYFIDIGVPDDFGRAQSDFQTLFPA